VTTRIATATQATTGGRAAAQALAAHDVEVVWGIPGTHNLELYAGLADAGIRHLSPRHEQGAAFAADGYSRVTGRVGVCVTTSGPAVLNAATALGQAYSDSVPVLIVAAGMPLGHPGLGNGELHETKDLGAALNGIVAYSHRVTSVAEIPVAIAQAFARMTTGRPRPVHVEIPLDLLAGHGEAAVLAPVAPPALAPDAAALDAAAAILAGAERPAILAGGGAVRAGAQLACIAERLGAPVACSINGKGTLPEDHPLSMGAGYANAAVRDAVDDSDVVLVVGSELAPSDAWWGPLPLAGKVVRVDVDPAQAVTNAAPVVTVVADAGLALDGLLARLGNGDGEGPPAERLDRAARWCAAARAHAGDEAARWSGLLGAIAGALGRDGIVAADSAMVAYFGAVGALPAYRPRSFLYPTGYGTLGYAVPAAIGAKVGRPAARVLALSGDGGVMFTLGELAAAAQARLALPVVVVDNAGYGEIRNEMRDRGDEPLGADLESPDFPALGRALGCHGVHADSPAAAAEALERAFAADRPTVIHVPEGAAAG
jgi:thiamine pyrophosphate-dependent acetolactate synthase large subunit-like protein